MRMIDDDRRSRQRDKAEARRLKEGRRHVVEYFHQVDDGYSHLALQSLAKLRARYDIDIVVRLVSALKDDNIPEPDLLQEMSRWDSSMIAPHFGLDFPADGAVPSPALTALARAILCRMDADQAATDGVRVSECLWRRDEAGLKALAAAFGTAPQAAVDAKLAAGDARRATLKHYSGAMFWYEGEWYWGVDRLSHLERRLSALGALRDDAAPLVAPKPAVASSFPEGARAMTLEYYPSLRSPYTAVSWEPTMALVKCSGIKLVMRPILPMVMRGVPATFNKGFYIWKDAAREARDLGVEYGKFYDPIGEPIKQGYSLYMWACERGKGEDFFGAFLKAAFARGVNTTRRTGMRKVVEMAGLDWTEAQHHLYDDSWREVLEENRVSMYRCGIWGVPSYRLLDRDGRQVLGVWGQDRLWLVSRKILEHA
ncbi:DsbA family protein [Rubrimonas cliftonensis]|nr:DsbA family protein [Rubrimonas cliftonensis]